MSTASVDGIVQSYYAAAQYQQMSRDEIVGGFQIYYPTNTSTLTPQTDALFRTTTVTDPQVQAPVVRQAAPVVQQAAPVVPETKPAAHQTTTAAATEPAAEDVNIFAADTVEPEAPEAQQTEQPEAQEPDQTQKLSQKEYRAKLKALKKLRGRHGHHRHHHHRHHHHDNGHHYAFGRRAKCHKKD